MTQVAAATTVAANAPITRRLAAGRTVIGVGAGFPRRTPCVARRQKGASVTAVTAARRTGQPPLMFGPSPLIDRDQHYANQEGQADNRYQIADGFLHAVSRIELGMAR
jgi:hypothetical protein